MDRNANVLFLGSSFWCRHLVVLLNEHKLLSAYTSKSAVRWAISRNKSVCLVGLGMPDTYKRFLYHGLAYLLHKLRLIRKRVIYWIGSDVTLLTSNALFIEGAFNIAGSCWLAEEVLAKGYVCEERLFPVKLPVDDLLPFPEVRKLQVLCYVPDAYHDLHGSPEIRLLVERFQNIDFTVIGGKGTWWPGNPGNVHFVGWTDDPSACLAAAHVVLRRTAHDSLSAFVREGLVAGRHVIFTYDFPGTIYVRRGDIEELQAQLSQLNARFVGQGLTRNKLDPEVRAWLTDTDSQLRALAEDYD